MTNCWHIISSTDLTDSPEEGQEIYCCLMDDKEVSDTVKLVADTESFRKLLDLFPHWKIFWQPLPEPPTPPKIISTVAVTKEA